MGTLYIVATPIGNLEDITIRSLKTLFSVDYIACEDTRNTGQLLVLLRQKFTSINQLIEVKQPKLISFYDEVEEQKTPEVIALLEHGRSVALVSDAGTPLISDPGFKLVRTCIKQNIPVTSLPGPSSLITALTLSGLPTNNFLFLGYPPPQRGKRKKFFKSLFSCIDTLEQLHPTIAFFESPHRITETLIDLEEIFGDIEVVITRELTKIHEEVLRGNVSSLQEKSEKLQGELVLLFNIPQE